MGNGSTTAGPDRVLPLLQQLFEVSAALNVEVGKALAEFDVSGSAGGLLWLLDPDRPPLRMREIARSLGCDPSNVTLMGDKLEEAGLLVRRPHPDDKRSRVLELTESGRHLRQRLLDRVVAATPLPTLTVREQDQLRHLLAKLSNAS
ncbi:MarR family winged helix-turn-helix transcriptional regulator [Kineococcus rhizosphaerae]|nr:MarR family transcriptional regulator [Kineococcus rhizosphaerae]